MAHAVTHARESRTALAAFERGNAAFDRGEWAAAEAAYRESLALHPGYALARYNYGLLLLTTGRPADAERELKAVVAAEPGFAAARLNLGTALHWQRRYAEADEQFRAAAQRGCTQPELPLNWSTTLTELGRFPEAGALLEPLVSVPEYGIDALRQLALVRSLEGRLEEAVELHRTLGRLGVRTAEARCNFAVTLLAAGRWAEGWAEYESRLELDPHRPNFARPMWNGESLSGRRILLWSEQGLGDVIQFVRFAEPLAAQGATVWLQCPEGAAELLATHRGIARVVQSPADFDYHLPLMSLPRVLGVTRENLPVHAPYLRADAARRDFWRVRLPGRGAFRVGLVWRGNNNHGRDHWRSARLEELAPLFGVPGVAFVSLQKGLGLEELARVGPGLGLHDLGSAYQSGGLADTAAIIAELDLVISVDTCVAHLTGSLGCPGWVALSEPPEWRWERRSSTSRWYPTLRLFRQPAFGQWNAVAEEMHAALKQVV